MSNPPKPTALETMEKVKELIRDYHEHTTYDEETGTATDCIDVEIGLAEEIAQLCEELWEENQMHNKMGDHKLFSRRELEKECNKLYSDCRVMWEWLKIISKKDSEEHKERHVRCYFDGKNVQACLANKALDQVADYPPPE